MVGDDGFWGVAKYKFEEVKKRYELLKGPKRWVSMRMRREFLGREKKYRQTIDALVA